MGNCWIVTLDVLKCLTADNLSQTLMRWIVTLDVLKYYMLVITNRKPFVE